MIHHYLPDSDAYWGVSHTRHLPELGDTPSDRVSGNTVLVQIQEANGGAYARVSLTLAEATLFASHLTEALLAKLSLINPTFQRTAENTGLFLDKGAITIKLIDNAVMYGSVASLTIPFPSAIQMLGEIRGRIDELLPRVLGEQA